MLVSQFEGIRMLEDETFNEFYTKIRDIRNSMINLGKKVSDAKLIKKILRSLPERFRIKVTTTKESKDLDTMKIEELVSSLQTYEFSLLRLRKSMSIALKVAKEKSNESSDDDGFAMFARSSRKMINSSRGKFRNKNVKSSENLKVISKEPSKRSNVCFNEYSQAHESFAI
jgi:RNA-binding protein YhbY